MALTYDGANIALYRNGINSGSVGKTGNLRENTWDMKIGNNPGSSTSYGCADGQLDEVRISSVARSINWLKTEHSNQDNSATFCSIGGSQEATGFLSPGTLASQVLDTANAGTIWDGLFWDETLLINTDITFEVRASDVLFFKDAASPSWISVGGTTPVISGLPLGRYMQWRVTLTTSDTANTPTLHEVRVYYY